MPAKRPASAVNSDHIGIRVRRWRLKRGLSQRVLADLAGLTQGYIAQIETGTAALDKRSTQLVLARALQVSLADLTDRPHDPTVLEQTAATRHLPELRAAIAELAFGPTEAPEQPPANLEAALATVADLHNACRYDDLLPQLPGLILTLGSRPHDPVMVRRLIWVTYVATFATKYLGLTDLAMLAAERCRAAAAMLGDEPAWFGLAEFATVHTLPYESRSLPLRTARKAIDRLDADAGDSATGQVYGMLHLSAAMLSAVGGDAVRSQTHLDEATTLAARLGEKNFGQLWFGPTNVEIWRLGVLAELHQGGAALPLQPFDVSMLGSSNRQATMYADLGRCLAQTRKHDTEARAALLRAEELAPQRVRSSPLVQETVGTMMRRARRSPAGTELQALAARVGSA